jgi:hypothetical protein
MPEPQNNIVYHPSLYYMHLLRSNLECLDFTGPSLLKATESILNSKGLLITKTEQIGVAENPQVCILEVLG